MTKKQGEYAEWINKYLFAFDTMETFNQMIQLQLDIRKPKLSKDFAPTEIYRILEEALPQLKDEDLHEVSDSFENIETAKNQLQQNQKDLEDLTELAAAFQRYHEQVQGKYAKYTLETQNKAEKFDLLFNETKAQLREFKQKLNGYIGKRVTLKSELTVLQEKLDRLKTNNIFQMEKEQQSFQEQKQQQEAQAKKIEASLAEDCKKQKEYQRQLDELELALTQATQDQQDFLEELADHVTDTGFVVKHQLLSGDFERLGYEMNVNYWQKQLREYRELFHGLMNDVYHFNQVKQQKEMQENELGQLEKAGDRFVYDLAHYREMFQTELTKMEVALGEWQKTLPFSFSEEEWRQMLQRLNLLFEEIPSYEQVKEPLLKAYNHYQLEQASFLQKQESLKEQLEEQLQVLQETLKDWRQRKLPVPERSEAQQADRRRLQEMGQSVVSFYEVIDFVDGISQIEKNQLEAALLKSGILDALVCEEKLVVENERQLVANPQLLVPTLADYLKPTVGETTISEGYIWDLLQSIVIEKEEQGIVALNLEGNYDLGIYQGKAGSHRSSQLIGKENQKRFLQEKIAETEAQIFAKEEELQESMALIRKSQATLVQTKEQFEQIPDSQELQDIQQSIVKQQNKIAENRQQQSLQNQVLSQVKEQYQVLYWKIQQFQEQHAFTISGEASELEQLNQQLNNYQEALDNLYEAFTIGKNLPNQIEQQQSFLKSNDDRQHELKEELAEIKQRVDYFDRSIQALEEQLVIEGAAGIRQEIQRTTEHYRQKNQELNRLNEKQIPETTSQADQLAREVLENQERSEFYALLYSCWLDVAEREINRYGKTDQLLVEQAKQYQGEEVLNKAAANLKQVQRSKQFSLGQYSPELVEIGEMDFSKLDTREWNSALRSEIQLLQAASRNDILYLLDEQNRRASVMAICQQVNQTIIEQEAFVDEADHKLFEEILLNSIGNTIKGLISKTEQWVKKMNAILQNTKDENRLRLSISWLPKNAENDREMNTRELVRILRQPAAMQAPEDLERMIRHFREKINYAKVLQENHSEGNVQTLHEVMREVLDYRNWFKFLLSFQKDNEPKRELTNQRFYKLSGGEKAVAMYLPLFTAMYARFEDAKREAPRMVCLDEAFAGVDELNIADLFGTLEDLGFDYLLNSQALWGDYDTVSSLNIYQLLRKANGTTVGISRSHWNGKKKEAVRANDGTGTT